MSIGLSSYWVYKYTSIRCAAIRGGITKGGMCEKTSLATAGHLGPYKSHNCSHTGGRRQGCKRESYNAL